MRLGLATHPRAIQKKAAVPREASTPAAPGRRLSCEIASRAAACYAKRYPDLKRTFCKSDGACNAHQAMAHFRNHGRREGRLFGCDGEANGTAPALESSCGRDTKHDESFRVAVCFWGVYLCARLSCHDSCVRSLNLISAQA